MKPIENGGGVFGAAGFDCDYEDDCGTNLDHRYIGCSDHHARKQLRVVMGAHSFGDCRHRHHHSHEADDGNGDHGGDSHDDGGDGDHMIPVREVGDRSDGLCRCGGCLPAHDCRRVDDDDRLRDRTADEYFVQIHPNDHAVVDVPDSPNVSPGVNPDEMGAPRCRSRGGGGTGPDFPDSHDIEMAVPVVQKLTPVLFVLLIPSFSLQ